LPFLSCPYGTKLERTRERVGEKTILLGKKYLFCFRVRKAYRESQLGISLKAKNTTRGDTAGSGTPITFSPRNAGGGYFQQVSVGNKGKKPYYLCA